MKNHINDIDILIKKSIIYSNISIIFSLIAIICIFIDLVKKLM